MQFTFPEVRFVKTASLEKQVSHVLSEAAEVDDACRPGNYDHLSMELLDLIHSAESALRILDEQYGVDLPALHAAVIKKNQERGYYV